MKILKFSLAFKRQNEHSNAYFIFFSVGMWCWNAWPKIEIKLSGCSNAAWNAWPKIASLFSWRSNGWVSVRTSFHFFNSSLSSDLRPLKSEFGDTHQTQTCVYWEEISNGLSFIQFRLSSKNLHVFQDKVSTSFLTKLRP